MLHERVLERQRAQPVAIDTLIHGFYPLVVLFASYIWRSLRARIRANAVTMLAVALLVSGGYLGFTFYFSLRTMLVDSAPRENIIVVSRGAASEGGSKLTLDTAHKLVLVPGIKQEGGAALTSRELVTRVNLSVGTDYESPVTIRGFDDRSIAIGRVTVVQGKVPDPSSLDIMLGKRVAASHPSLPLGAETQLPGGTSHVVGIFAAHGSPLEDEVWTPRAALELQVKTKLSSSMTLVADDAGHVAEIVDKINNSKDINAQAAPIASFRASVAGLDGIARAVFVLLLLLSVVATFAIATTMNAAAVTRMPELAALAAIGVRRRLLARIILLESVSLAVIGAIVGVLVSVLITSRIDQFSLGADPVEISSSPLIPLLAVGVGALVGFAGGIFPALMVRRLDIMQALR
jgi:putative ABC transport system permease protein